MTPDAHVRERLVTQEPTPSPISQTAAPFSVRLTLKQPKRSSASLAVSAETLGLNGGRHPDRILMPSGPTTSIATAPAATIPFPGVTPYASDQDQSRCSFTGLRQSPGQCNALDYLKTLDVCPETGSPPVAQTTTSIGHGHATHPIGTVSPSHKMSESDEMRYSEAPLKISKRPCRRATLSA